MTGLAGSVRVVVRLAVLTLVPGCKAPVVDVRADRADLVVVPPRPTDQGELAAVPKRRVDLDAAPRVAEVLLEGADIRSLAVDATHVYVTQGDGAIRKRAFSGGEPVTIATSAQPSDVVVGGGSVYWIDDPGKSFVRQVSKGGGAVSIVGTDEHLKVWALAADGAAVYWATYFDVTRVPLDGGPSTRVAHGDGIMTMAVAGSHLATAEVLSGVIRVTSLGGGGGEHTVATWKFPSPLALDDQRVWFVGPDEERPEALPFSAPSPAAPPLPSRPARHPIATDSASVYWATAAGDVKRLAKRGGASSLVTGTQGQVTAIVVDATHLYWSTARALFRVAK